MEAWLTKLSYYTRPFFFRKDLCRRGDALRRLGLRALAEAVLEAARHVSHVAHAARAVRAPPQRFLGPVKPAHLGARVAARGAHLLLQVEGDLAASPAGRVRLRVPLSERRGTFRLRGGARGETFVCGGSGGPAAVARRRGGCCGVSGDRWRVIYSARAAFLRACASSSKLSSRSLRRAPFETQLGVWSQYINNYSTPSCTILTSPLRRV